MSMIARFVGASIAVVLLCLGTGCSGGGGECTPGTKGCPCTAKGACSNGLSCQANTCVQGATGGTGGSTVASTTSKASGGASSAGVRSSSGGATTVGGSTSIGGSSGAGGVSSTGSGTTVDAGADARADASPEAADAPSGSDAVDDTPMVPPDTRDAAAGDLAVDTAGVDAPPFVPPEQWLLDPSFEEPGTSAWTWVTKVTPGHTTGHAAFMDSADSNSKWVGQTVDLRGYEAAQATISASIKTENVVPGPNFWECPSIHIQMQDAAGKVVDSAGNLLKENDAFLFCTTGTQAFARQTKTLTVPLGTAKIRVEMAMASPASGKAWFDDVELRLAPPSTDDNVTVPVWTAPTAAWCARPGYGLGTVMDGLQNFDSELYPHDVDIAKNKCVARTLFTQVAVTGSGLWSNRVMLRGAENTQLALRALEGSGVLTSHAMAVYHWALPSVGGAWTWPDDISRVMLDAGFGIRQPWGAQENVICNQPFAAPALSATHAAIRDRVLGHVGSVVADFGGLPIWYVVNEIGNLNDQCFPSAFAEPGDTEVAAGSRLLAAALDQAEKASPDTLGLYNDNGVSDFVTTNTLDCNRTKTLELVKGTLARRKHMDGIGSESHLWCQRYGQTGVDLASCRIDVSATKASFDALNAAGVPVYITEFEVQAYRDWSDGTGENPDTGALDANQQATMYADFIGAALNHPGVLGVTIWKHKQDRIFPFKKRTDGMTDAQYWPTGGGLYDDLYQPKPAYTSVVKVLQDYYAAAGCDYVPGSRVAAVRGDAVNQTRFATTGTATLVTKGDAVQYLFNTPHGGTWQLELQLEADAPGPNVFNVAIDGANKTTVTLDATVADGTVVEKAAYPAPIALGRGTHRVRIELGQDADTCTGTSTDACDGWGIIRGLRLKRVGP